MHRLRRHRFLARLVLAWFAFTLGVAVAAPVLDPQGLAWLCTTSATDGRSADAGQEDGGMASGHGLHCPLCASPAAPPPAPLLRASMAQGSPSLAVAPSAPPPSRQAVRPGLARGPPDGVVRS